MNEHPHRFGKSRRWGRLAVVLGVVAVLAACTPLTVDPEKALHVSATISELPVPPTAPSDAVGSCTAAVNPHGTGCVSGAWGGIGSPGVYYDPHYILTGVFFAGAPASGPSSVYKGPQVLLLKTDGTVFPNGDAWKCLTCGVAFGPDIVTGSTASAGTGNGLQYPPPHALPGDHKALVGNGILECGPNGATYDLADPRCTPANTRVNPIYWGDTPLGKPQPPPGVSAFGNGREWRLNPDGVHLGWGSFVLDSTGAFTEHGFFGRLQFDPATSRYNLVNVSLLFNPDPQDQPYVVQPGSPPVLKYNQRAFIGEFRGFTSDGKSAIGIQARESDNVDAFATSLTTGDSTPLTNHAEYVDPIQQSPDGKWSLADQVIGSGRLDFISGMQGIPPLTDQIPTLGYISGIRNNVNRRFFHPWLVDATSRRSEDLNTDPSWNAAADPTWLADSTAAVWAENLACGANPTPHQCADSTEPGGRNARLMIARFPSFKPSAPIVPAPVADSVPWGLPYTVRVTPIPPRPHLPAGTYTVYGAKHGTATVVITENAAKTAIASISVTYDSYGDVANQKLSGTESTTSNADGSVTWHEDLTTKGRHKGTKVTSPDGFTLQNDILFSSIFRAIGTMTTTIDGQTYIQPANGT